MPEAVAYSSTAPWSPHLRLIPAGVLILVASLYPYLLYLAVPDDEGSRKRRCLPGAGGLRHRAGVAFARLSMFTAARR